MPGKVGRRVKPKKKAPKQKGRSFAALLRETGGSGNPKRSYRHTDGDGNNSYSGEFTGRTTME